MNRTGTIISPLDSIKTIKGASELTHPTKGDCTEIGNNRILHMQEAEGIGSIAFNEQIMTGNHAMMDKLGERLVFERMGARLYEALITKYNGTNHQERLPELTRIEQFYLEKLKHFQNVSEVITNLGGDPTALTPAADVIGAATQGWIQVLTDPRTTFLQSLEIMLHLELVDNAGWELMIELAERNGLGDLAIQFQQILDEEAFHLITVKQWVQELTLNNEIISPEQNAVLEFDIDSVTKH
jgi:hypothetical protein